MTIHGNQTYLTHILARGFEKSRLFRLPSFIIIFFLLISLLAPVTIPVNAQLAIDRVQRVYSPNPVQIPADRDGAFRLFFPYYNPGEQAMKDVVGELRIQGSGFVFVPSDTYDYYNPDGGDIVTCDKLKDVPKHPVQVEFASPASIVYTPQSSTSTETGGGTASGELKPKASGCIQVTLAIDPSVIVGQKAAVYFNWYLQGELDFQKLPPIGIYNIEAVKGKNVANECKVDEEIYDGLCVKKCDLGKVRNLQGLCIDQSLLNQLTNNPLTNSSVPGFDTYRWLMGIFSTALFISLCTLVYSIIVYRRLTVRH